jgi:hypothetical protein
MLGDIFWGWWFQGLAVDGRDGEFVSLRRRERADIADRSSVVWRELRSVAWAHQFVSTQALVSASDA